jgi:hypothetical protein
VVSALTPPRKKTSKKNEFTGTGLNYLCSFIAGE